MGRMRQLTVAIALAGALLAGAFLGVGSTARAADVGANDDTGKYLGDGGASMYGDMAALGLRQIVLPRPLQAERADRPSRTRRCSTARFRPRSHAGLRVVLAVYPYPPRELEAGLATPSLFGSYVGAVASIYPEVKQFVVGNEPNQPAFWRPQFNARGADALGAGLRPVPRDRLRRAEGGRPGDQGRRRRASRRAGTTARSAKSNVSTSPVRFLRALGTWYRASGRDLPLMDGFSFHPYPNNATDPLDQGYGWPNAGFVNLDRVKQALWDAFHGTAQPTTLEGLKIHLDEVGWQVEHRRVSPATRARERRRDRRADAGGGLRGPRPPRRVRPGRRRGELLRLPRRRPADRVPGRAAAARRDRRARRSRRSGPRSRTPPPQDARRSPVRWAPRLEVLGASAAVERRATGGLAVRLAAGEDARARVCLGARTAIDSDARCRAAAARGASSARGGARGPERRRHEGRDRGRARRGGEPRPADGPAPPRAVA